MSTIEQPLGGSVGGEANTITDRQLFDHANADPAPATPPAPPQTPLGEPQSPSDTGGAEASLPSTRPDLQPQPQGQPRDPQGKFAPKQQGQQEQQRQPEDHRVPLRELLAERDARQRLEAHAAELTRAVVELQQRFNPQQPQPQPQGPETIFDDPRAYLEQNVINPLRQEGQQYMRMEAMRVKDDWSREHANTQFTPQVVNAALAAMQQVRNTPQGQFVFSQIMASGHPYGELVKWHRHTSAMSAIGADPDAWLKQQQEKWLDDPNAQRVMMERMRARQNGGNGARGNPPNVQLPPSLSSVASTANRAQEPGDLSSQSLWNFANR